MDTQGSEPYLDQGAYEQLRDRIVIAARGLSKGQMLDLTDALHVLIRHRGPRSWDEARAGTAGFD